MALSVYNARYDTRPNRKSKPGSGVSVYRNTVSIVVYYFIQINRP
jgi:hypothetical protein